MSKNNQNKQQNLSQNQVFEQKYLTFLRQLAKETAKEHLKTQKNIFPLYDVDQIKNEPCLFTNLFLKEDMKNEFELGQEFAIEKVLQGISKFEDVIDLLKKNLYIDQHESGQDNEVIQSTRRQYFQKIKQQQQQYNLTLEYPVQQYTYGVNNDPYLNTINYKLINQQKFSLSQPTQFNVNFQNQKRITGYMQVQMDFSHSSLIKQDQSLKREKENLQEIFLFTLNVNSKNKTSLMSMYRYLISLQNNVIVINDTYNEKDQYQKKFSNLKNSEAFEILDEAFVICLSNKNLQSLKIVSQSSLVFEALLSALTNTDLSQSNISILSINISQIDVEESQIQTFFQCLSEIPHLQYLDIIGINVSTQETLNSMNVVLKKLKYVGVELKSVTDSIDLKLNLENAVYLKLIIHHQLAKLTIQQQLNLFASISSSKSVKFIELFAQQQQQITKDEQQQKQEKNKNKKSKAANKNQNSNDNQVSSTSNKKQEAEDYQITDNQLLQLFSQKTQLELAYFNMRYNPLILQILLLKLKNSPLMRRCKFNFKKEQNLLQQIDLSNLNSNKSGISKEVKVTDQEQLPMDVKELYEILNNSQKIDQFQLTHDSINISYKRMIKSLNFYKLDVDILPQQKNKQLLKFQNQFLFNIKNLKRVSISSPFEIENLMIIDQICESFSNSPLLESISFKLFDSYDTQICRQKQNYSYPNVSFFKRLEAIQDLEYLSIDIPINQDILNSIEHFYKNYKQIRSFSFSRNQYYYQFDTNYTDFFNAITSSSSLEHFKIDLKMENTKIFQEVPLDSFEDLMQQIFYEPLIHFVKSKNKNLRYIDYSEELLNKKGCELLLSSIEQYPHSFYFKFDEKLIQQIQSEKNLQQIFQKCVDKGYIVKKDFTTPLLQYFQQA